MQKDTIKDKNILEGSIHKPWEVVFFGKIRERGRALSGALSVIAEVREVGKYSAYQLKCCVISSVPGKAVSYSVQYNRIQKRAKQTYWVIAKRKGIGFWFRLPGKIDYID